MDSPTALFTLRASASGATVAYRKIHMRAIALPLFRQAAKAAQSRFCSNRLFAAAALVVAFSVSTFISAPRIAHACSCPGGMTVAERMRQARLWSSGIVFRGTVLDRILIADGRGVFTTFGVTQQWLGAPTRIVTLLTAHPRAMNCGMDFGKGEDWFVFAGRQPGWVASSYTTAVCAGSVAVQWGPTDAQRMPPHELADFYRELGPSQPQSWVCPQVTNRIPPPIQDAAHDDPTRYAGWGLRSDPGKPSSPYNPWRVWLSLTNPSVPFGPGNAPLWRASCP